MKRRESLKLIAAASLAAAFPGCTVKELDSAAARVLNGSGTPEFENRTPTVFSEHEYRTIFSLVDLIIPADDRSGSATDAEVPAFIDFLLEEVESMRQPARSGLAWIDTNCQARYGGVFSSLDRLQQVEMLDTIAYPEDHLPENREGVEFFSWLRDATASGFWSSKMGVEDLGYSGNSPKASWDGCPTEAMDHLGLTYEDV